MAGTTALEPAASAVTVNDIEEHGRHRKSLEVHHRQRYCVSPCVSRTLLPLGKEAEAKRAEGVSAELRKRRSRSRAVHD
jgi:hypothetical protein